MARWPAGVWPEMCFAQSVPDGRVERVRCGITPGKESGCVVSTKRSAFATDEWNVMKPTQIVFPHRLGQADLRGQCPHIGREATGGANQSSFLRPGLGFGVDSDHRTQKAMLAMDR